MISKGDHMKMSKNYDISFLFLLLVLVFLVIGCTPEPKNVSGSNVPGTPTEDSTPTPPAQDTGLFGPKYKGTILAGKEAPYIEFNTEDYDTATKEGKIILLYFYSLQSAPSIADQSTIYDAFNDMTNPNIIGFRVNIDDDNTSAAEVKLASDLGVDLPRVKVIMKDGKVLQTSNIKWNANDYLRQITQYLS